METLGTGVGKVDIKFQIGSVRSITFAFTNVDISTWTFEFYLKASIGDRLKTLSLTLGAGLSIPIYSESILASFTAVNTSIEEGEYYWELRRADANIPLLSGNAYFNYDSQQGTENVNGVVNTIAYTNTTIEVTIMNGFGSVVGMVIFCGVYDASTNLFPSTGGTLASGIPAKANQFLLSVGGILGGVFVPAGVMIMAKVDTPGQTASNWILPTAF